MNILLLAVYIVLVLAVTLPLKSRDRAFWDGRDAMAFLCSLLSTCVLPWSGIPIFSCADIGSRAWFPLTMAATILAGHGDDRAFLPKLFFSAGAASAVVSMTWFTRSAGVPGDLFSIEGLSMILRLESIRDGRLIAAAICLSAGLIVSFAGLCPNGLSLTVSAFTFSAFVTIVFFPFNSAGLFGIKPPQAVLVDCAVLFGTTVLIFGIFMKPLSSAIFGKEGRQATLWALAACTFSVIGCCLLIASQSGALPIIF